ncbi:MAG: malto-oligosyltrehalose trehalohydrolase [Allorhizobium sp.]
MTRQPILPLYGAHEQTRPLGAVPSAGGTAFRVWAPTRKAVSVVIEDGAAHRLERGDDGYFEGDIAGIGAGMLYRLRLDDDEQLYADPASRFQPQGAGGPSMVVDPGTYAWSDQAWAGIKPTGQVLYEMHIGTFTAEGTFAAAREKLSILKDIGITVLEVMPINEFFGDFGWGYDGVLPFAPTRLYGEPDDVRAFVDHAHALGIGVILDVVYNHFGTGDRFADFTPNYFTDRYRNDWGLALNFEGRDSGGVRDLVTGNAVHWISEYHFDGLRLDATQAIEDSSNEHILAELSRKCRVAAGDRSIYIIGENEPQLSRLVRAPDEAGYGLDAVWNDDFHHSAMVAMTGRNEAYYHDYKGAAQEFIAAAKHGYLFQGQRYDWQNYMRGTAGLDLRPADFVHFLQNHDQVANSARGLRLDRLSTPARLRAATALLLLGPQTPMLFQGQEFGSSAPFYYFADQSGEIGDLVRDGRTQSLAQFPSLKDKAMIARFADPIARQTFERSKLDWSEFDEHPETVGLHRDLLQLRRQYDAFACVSEGITRIDGSVLSPSAFLLRFFGRKPAEDLILMVNFGADLPITSIPDPLFAPPFELQWTSVWSSEQPAYGGTGVRHIDVRDRWVLAGDSAVLLTADAPEPMAERPEMEVWQESISH